MSELRSDTFHLQQATNFAEMTTSSVDGFRHALADKLLLKNQYPLPRLRWIRAINRVMLQNYVAKVKARLEAVAKLAKDRSSRARTKMVRTLLSRTLDQAPELNKLPPLRNDASLRWGLTDSPILHLYHNSPTAAGSSSHRNSPVAGGGTSSYRNSPTASPLRNSPMSSHSPHRNSPVAAVLSERRRQTIQMSSSTDRLHGGTDSPSTSISSSRLRRATQPPPASPQARSRPHSPERQHPNQQEEHQHQHLIPPDSLPHFMRPKSSTPTQSLFAERHCDSPTNLLKSIHATAASKLVPLRTDSPTLGAGITKV